MAVADARHPGREPPWCSGSARQASLELHGPGLLALCGFLELRVPRGVALVHHFPGLLLDLLPVVAALGLAFCQHLRKGGSSNQQVQQKQEGPPLSGKKSARSDPSTRGPNR